MDNIECHTAFEFENRTSAIRVHGRDLEIEINLTPVVAEYLSPSPSNTVRCIVN